MFLFKADYLNAHCHCSTLDKNKLEYPQYFSEQPHFISRDNLGQIEKFIQAYERALNSRITSGEVIEKGIFNSYDFHMSENGPQLIEINSNAAGAVLGMYAARQMTRCCDGMDNYLPVRSFRFDAEAMVDMFRNEFAQRFPDRALRTVAIVDEAPEQQFFYPEFLLVQRLLKEHGIDAVIVAPEAIEIRNNIPYAQDIPLDFIYNRSTDFYFEKENTQVLKEVYERGLATVSPNPAVHALYARKSNLAAVWSQTADSWADIDLIRKRIPETVLVTNANRAQLWETRRQWFFKPVGGYGGKAVYRGDKLTQRVWSEMSTGAYIAQKFVPAQMRQLSVELALKYDLRVYTYRDQILGMMARYYQGQTTNFRTEHGGLASVLVAA